ncbi:hypothetical protein [Wohlfahrtiimonas chitiniclastica]|uniref:hypothetical protein n=1 Tax=Wohlfahrtiimonas chitiniclastica TaxID=400946 RepID=UPI000B97FBC3|nr:hypothetical protein [Wohlfahrtiimonas chitiniclastica]MBS7836287.1 hypothetical protein [Wohlfahrtiimonas chitiniclastica]OYQ89685.1 hypothetical protein B9T21_02740 [Wohlfahrtiimonas chitiniclastica]
MKIKTINLDTKSIEIGLKYIQVAFDLDIILFDNRFTRRICEHIDISDVNDDLFKKITSMATLSNNTFVKYELKNIVIEQIDNRTDEIESFIIFEDFKIGSI